MTDAPLPIREAAPADLPAIGALLERRDGIPLAAGNVAHTFRDLDPARCRAWVAWDGDRAVGLSAMDLVDVRSGDGPVRAAYWTNLFVEPGYRDRMLYPRLPLAMIAAARAARLPALLAAVRRKEVAAAHEALGFDEFGRRPVLAKALRPLTFLARRGLAPRLVRAVATAFDLPWSLALRIARTGAPSPMPGDPATLAGLIDDRPGRVWTAGSLAERLEPHLDGAGYRVLVDRTPARAALAWRAAVREDGLRIGVLMALAGDDPGGIGRLLQAFEEAADQDGCALLVALAPGTEPGDGAIARAGFIPTPETYVLLEARALARTGTSFADLGERWRFEFVDHDAL